MKLRPSQAKCWSRCTAQPAFVESVKDRLPPENDTFTGPGIEAHRLAALWLTSGQEPEFPDPEMHAAVKDYVELVRATMAEGDLLLVEQNLPLTYRTESNGGTIDALVVGTNRISILDLKYGQGVSVEAEENEQLILYAMAAWEYLTGSGFYELDEKETLISLFIFQPRCREGEPLRSWSNLRLDELRAYYDQIREAADAIHEDRVCFNPSEAACRFCRAKSLCAAKAQQASESAGFEVLAPEAPQLPSPHALTSEQVSRVLHAKKDLIEWLNAIEESVEAQLLAGKEFPGWKLVAGRSIRKWKDEVSAEKLLALKLSADERFIKKLISPAQAEKLLKDKDLSTRFKNCFERETEKPDGKPTLAPETDPRPALVVNAESAGLTALTE